MSRKDVKETAKAPKEDPKKENANAANVAAEEAAAEDTANKELAELKERLEKTEKELTVQKETLLRTAAEYDNFRKRSEREKAAIYTDAESDTVAKILPVADNMERALAQSECSAEDMRKGVEMVSAQLVEALTKLGVTAMGEVGEPFNPDYHNAVAHIEDENLGDNVISAVFQKGYRIGDKIVRHAMVQVAN